MASIILSSEVKQSTKSHAELRTEAGMILRITVFQCIFLHIVSITEGQQKRVNAKNSKICLKEAFFTIVVVKLCFHTLVYVAFQRHDNMTHKFKL